MTDRDESVPATESVPADESAPATEAVAFDPFADDSEPGTVATTGDLLKAAKKVWASWGDHPDTKDFVEQFRLKRLDAKYQRMIPGYKPGSVYPSDGAQALTDGEVIAQIAARVKRR